MDYTRITVRPVTPAIGAVISGVDISQPLDDETVGEIRRAYLEYLVVFFRDQTVNPGQLVAFARRFGEIGYYPFV